MLWFWLVPAILLLVFIGNRGISLHKNYTEALKLDLPIIVSWTSWEDIPWALGGPVVKALLQPFGYYENGFDLGSFGWPFLDRNEMHAKHGPAFAHVTPFRTTIFISDVAASKELLMNWKTWTKEPALYSMFNVFGPNVTSSNGDDWSRHRKITSHGFKDSNLKLVWNSSVEQIAGMLAKWSGVSAADPARGVTLKEVGDDAHKVALHVLAYAAFGKRYAFDRGVDKPEMQHKLSYAKALETILLNVGPQLFLVASLFANSPLWILPSGLQHLLLAIREFKQYLVETVDAERKKLGTGDDTNLDNLMSSVVRANEAAKRNKNETELTLSDDDLYGNLFIFNAAGHDTSAASLGFAVPLLAAHPDIQAWCQEEVDAILADTPDPTYSNSWHRMVRIRALMYETVRFFSPVPFLPKWSGHQHQTIEIRGKTYDIPPDMFVAVNMNAIHWDPEVWGKDTKKFSPKRWLKAGGKPGQETFGGPPANGEVMLWSFGPRICPGMKFSQVEFVACFFSMLRLYSFRPAQKSTSEDFETARLHLEETLMDAEHHFTMRIRKPESAGIVCVSRP